MTVVPLPTTGIFVVMALLWGWASDGPCHGIRWPFIYVGAAITVSFQRLNDYLKLIYGKLTTHCFSCRVLMLKTSFYSVFSCGKCHCMRTLLAAW